MKVPFSARNVQGCAFVVVSTVGVGAVLQVQLKKRRISPARDGRDGQHRVNTVFTEVFISRNESFFSG